MQINTSTEFYHCSQHDAYGAGYENASYAAVLATVPQ